jgi:uncharacterized protein YjiS (DUF1127 family)
MKSLRQHVEEWVSALRASAELNRMDRRQLSRLAADVGVSIAELREFGASGPEATVLLDRRLANLRLTSAAHAQPALHRDMQRVCLRCTAKSRCEYDLDLHPSEPIWMDYCPNSDALNALR